jgi:hypothetical protein
VPNSAIPPIGAESLSTASPVLDEETFLISWDSDVRLAARNAAVGVTDREDLPGRAEGVHPDRDRERVAQHTSSRRPTVHRNFTLSAANHGGTRRTRGHSDRNAV